MNFRHTGILCALLACSAALYAAPPRENLLGEPVPEAGGLPGGFDICGAGAPCVRLWVDMNADERAKLWPYLDDVTRAARWREMSRRERNEMRSHLSERECQNIRRSYSVKSDKEKEHAATASSRFKDESERRLMRRQIIEVNMEFSGPRANTHRGEEGRGRKTSEH